MQRSENPISERERTAPLMSVQRIRSPPDSECCDSLLRTKHVKFAYAERQHTIPLPEHLVATVTLLLAIPVRGED